MKTWEEYNLEEFKELRANLFEIGRIANDFIHRYGRCVSLEESRDKLAAIVGAEIMNTEGSAVESGSLDQKLSRTFPKASTEFRNQLTLSMEEAIKQSRDPLVHFWDLLIQIHDLVFSIRKLTLGSDKNWLQYELALVQISENVGAIKDVIIDKTKIVKVGDKKEQKGQHHSRHNKTKTPIARHQQRLDPHAVLQTPGPALVQSAPKQSKNYLPMSLELSRFIDKINKKIIELQGGSSNRTKTSKQNLLDQLKDEGSEDPKRLPFVIDKFRKENPEIDKGGFILASDITKLLNELAAECPCYVNFDPLPAPRRTEIIKLQKDIKQKRVAMGLPATFDEKTNLTLKQIYDLERQIQDKIAAYSGAKLGVKKAWESSGQSLLFSTLRPVYVHQSPARVPQTPYQKALTPAIFKKQPSAVKPGGMAAQSPSLSIS